MANNETRLKATYQSCYPKYNSEKGTVTDVFVYEIKGSPAGLKRYEEVQGDNFRADKETDVPLYFSTTYFGDNGEVKITQNDKVVANTDATRKMRSRIDSAGSGKLGDEMAKLAAQLLLGVTAMPTQQQQVEEIATEDDDEKDVQNILDQADEEADLSGEKKKTVSKKK